MYQNIYYLLTFILICLIIIVVMFVLCTPSPTITMSMYFFSVASCSTPYCKPEVLMSCVQYLVNFNRLRDMPLQHTYMEVTVGLFVASLRLLCEGSRNLRPLLARTTSSGRSVAGLSRGPDPARVHQPLGLASGCTGIVALTNGFPILHYSLPHD